MMILIFTVKANHPGEVYGMDVAGIFGKQHLVVVDYKSCCIFDKKLPSLMSSSIIEVLNDIFCDVGSPDRVISDNAKYFVSDEFQEFMMDWSIQHVTSSHKYPQGNRS